MVEAVTDGEVGLATTNAPPLAWYDQTNGEIGDICNAAQGAITGGDGISYTVQKEFSNVANDCIVSRTPAGNDFSISANPASLTIAQNGTGSATINTATTSGSAQTVSLGVSGVQSGASASFSPGSITSGGDSTLAQTFVAPTGAASLSLWYKMTCPDTLTYDWATVSLMDNTSGSAAAPVPRFCATNAAWVQATAAVIAGHTYTLTLLSHDDNFQADPSFTLF